MASFNQDARTDTIVLNAAFQAPCMSEGLVVANPFDARSVVKSLSSASSIPSEQSNVVFSSVTSKPSVYHLPVSNMCAPTSSGEVSQEGSNRKFGDNQCVSSSIGQVDNFPHSSKMYPGGLKYPIDVASSRPLIAVQHSETFVTVPFGWKRVISSGKVIYISPSEIYLQSLQEVAVYLQTEGTCKCGLECPLMLNKVFNFNPMATTKSWNVNDLSWNDPTKLCNHKRKIAAMATFQNTTGPLSNFGSIREFNPLLTPSTSKKENSLTNKKKRVKGKSKSPFDSVLVSQLLAQRDKLGQRKVKTDDMKFLCNEDQLTSQSSSFKTDNLNPAQPKSVIDQRSNLPKPVGFLDEQNLSVFNKITASNFNSSLISQNSFVSANVFQDKKMLGCGQSCQPCTSDNNSIMYPKHVNTSSMPCVVQDQSNVRHSEPVYSDKSSMPPLEPIGSSIHQGLFNPQQFIHNNIPTNIALNCNFSSTNVGGQIFNTQLPINHCITMNTQNQTSTDIVAAVSQPSNSGAYLFSDVQNHLPQPINSGNISNMINPVCGPNFSNSPHDIQLPTSSVSINSARFTPTKDESIVVPRSKSKKSSKVKINKMNSVLDRGSPCPNIDVRQIPSEHHRPPPGTFTAITSSSVGPAQNQLAVNNQIPFTSDINMSFGNKNLTSQSMPCRTNQIGNIFMSKPSDSCVTNSNSNTLFQSQNKNFQNAFQYQEQNQYSPNSFVTFENNRNKGKSSPQSKVSVSNQQILCSISSPVVSTTNWMHTTANSTNYIENNFPENNRQTPSLERNSSASGSPSSSVKLSTLADIKMTDNVATAIHIAANKASNTCIPTSSVTSVAMSTSVSNNPNIISSSPLYNVSTHSNIINIPMSVANPSANMNNFNTLYSTQNMIPNNSQMRQSIAMSQQPIVYNQALHNNNAQRPEMTNFFMQNTSAANLDGVSGLRPSLMQQDSSGMLVQQVLSQKITSDYSGNMFSAASRAQVVQQVGGMVIPASAANNVNSQQLVLAPTQMRMSGPGGLITMLPSTMTNSMMNGTQVLTASAQQMGPQMVLPDNLRPNFVNPQQQILHNNCFIMSNQPTFVTRPPNNNIVSCQVPCPTSVSTGPVGTYNVSPNNINSTTMISTSMLHKPPDRNELSQNLNNEIMQNNKEQNSMASSLHVLQSSSQRLSMPRVDSSTDVAQDNWVQKQEMKNTVNDGISHITGPFLNNVSRSNSVPSNISGHTMFSNCGQVLINSDNANCVSAQAMSASNISRMTNVIPIVGGQCALNSPMPPLSVPNVTAVTTTMTQMIPAIGIAPQILGQPVQPMVQVINTVPFNSMQNAVVINGGSNVLPQTVRLDTLQTSPVVGTPAPTVFNGVVIPPNTMNCVPSAAANVSNLRQPHPVNHNEEMRLTFENIHDTRSTPGSTCSTPASSCSSTPISSSSDTHNMALRALSPAIRKRNRDGKRKANSQTVASMLQHGAHNSSNNSNSSNSVTQQQHPPPTQHIQQQHSQQLSNLQQQFLQPPVLQTLTVLPQQPRPILQQPVMNYNSIGSVGGPQILATGLTSPLGIVQPLSMLGVTPTGAVIQNIPVQQVVPGPHFQSLTVLPHTALPQEQSVVVNDTSSMNVHPTQMHSAFATGSIVPNMVAANSVLNTHVGGSDVLVTSQSQSATENMSVSAPFQSVFSQSLPPIAQSLSSTTNLGNVKTCMTGNTQTSSGLSYQISGSVSTYKPSSTVNTTPSDNKDETTTSKTDFLTEPNHKARSIGVQSSCMEQNVSVQTVTSTNSGRNSVNILGSSPNTKMILQENCVDDSKSKFEGENSSTMLSSGGESCESPWPDPVNLSAAVRAVVQEQVDSNEEIISHSLTGDNPINFLDCTSSIRDETSEQTPTSSMGDNMEESNDGNSVLDLRTMSGEFVAEPDNCQESGFRSEGGTIQSLLQLNKWRQNQSPSNSQRDPSDNVVESASTASSESSEQTNTDCNVTSDSGVESSQEPMNLACIREEESINADITSQNITLTTSMSYGGEYIIQDDEKLNKKGLKRLKREIDMSYDDFQEEDSDDGTALSPPLPPQPRTFNDGDLVWGQIRGFPSWPGKLVPEEDVKGTHKTENGKLWVRWFGDHTFTQVEPDKLKTLSEGLEAHHRARKRHRRGRKMNSQLENAIQEAMMELDRQTSDLITDTEEDGVLSVELAQPDSSMSPTCSRTNKPRGGYKRR